MNPSTIMADVVFYAGLPTFAIWGWAHWMRSGRTAASSPVLAKLSLSGFAISSASALLALSAALYARAAGGFGYYSSSLLRVYRVGFLMSFAGTILSLAAVWRRSPLRWFALILSLGVLAFWLMSIASE